MRTRSRRRRRRGVLLLIVLCVLFMFLLLAITYAVVASKERSVTRLFARVERSGDPPNVVLDEIAMMLFRDTNDVHSPFRGLSLLEGIDGNVSFRGTVGGAPTPQAGGQFLQFTPSTANFNSTPNYYKGCVLTMLSGQCSGLSTRIVASASGSITVMRFQADAGLYDPAQNDTFLINGRPYCGMGRGYNPTTASAGGPANTAVDPNGWLYALLPNPVGFQPSAGYSSDPNGPGGANMDYTACDYNSPYLALMLNNTNVSQTGIIPSFFRPALYNYWASQPGNLTSNALLLRKISFRPIQQDHPAFYAQTNPSYAPGSPASSFDVDNLGGGIADSIWIDPGLPAITMRDGRTAKILVAPCILDLDGRINVNAHGSYLETDTNVTPTTWQNGVLVTSSTNTIAGLPNGGVIAPTAPATTSPGTVTVPIGQGYGPAEIKLSGVFSAAEVKALVMGISGGWPGRYGGSPGTTAAGWSQANRNLELVKFFEFPISTSGITDSPLALLTSFQTPPDMKGRHAIVLDPRGQPNPLTPGSSPVNSTYWTNEIRANTSNSIGETPYGFKLDRSVARPGRYVSGATFDNPFTPGELEPVLRQYDIDVRSLPQRLYSMIPSILTDANKRNKLTTDSWDLSSPNFQAPRALRPGLSAAGLNQAFGITDLVNAEFKMNCPTLVGNSAEIAKLLPPELIAGVRMDINRPFGDGRKNGAAVTTAVDSPGGISSASPSAPDNTTETLTTVASTASNLSAASGYNVAVPFNLVNGSGTNGLDPVLSAKLPPGVQARQLMARHLYALMMLFADQTSTGWSVEPGLSPTQMQQLTARRIAQWAINAVSFRDATSIMTPFMYHWDIYQSTYKGWTVDGDPGNQSQSSNGNYGIVWACKPPDAVLTETIAFHDKRIADTAWDSGNSKMTTDTPPDAGGGIPTTAKTPPGGNFDQTRVPQGSLFIEINCTRNPNSISAPTDLYTNVGTATSPSWALNLSRMTPSGNCPVWRLAISTSRISNPNCDMLNQSAMHPDTTTYEPTTDATAAGMPWQQMNLFNPGLNVPIERVVWLGSSPPAAGLRATLGAWNAASAAQTQIYYNRMSANINIMPGSYAIIGPRLTTYVGSAGTYNAPFGANPKQWGIPSGQKITIATSLAAQTGLAVTDFNGTSTLPASTSLKSGNWAAQGMVVAADPPPQATWSNSAAYTAQNAVGIGLSVSEPLPAGGTPAGSAYYPQPTVAHTSSAANGALAGVYDAYDDLTQTTQSANKYLDQPLEEVGSNVTYPTLVDPLNTDSITKTATTQNYRTVFLQRLADPTSDYDALRNPYITVDWMPIDLTVFNGEELPATSNTNDAGAANPLASVLFGTRQRGGSNPASLPNPATFNLWAPIQQGDTPGNKATQPTSSKGTNFAVTLNNTLGTLNQAFLPALTNAIGSVPYVGDPSTPFPWIAWNARPYATPLELLNVPASAPERLLFEFNSPATPIAYGTAATQIPPAGANPYQPATGPAAQNPNARGPFGHLLNFFNSASSSYTAGTSLNLFHIFDYVQVPSKFVGTETWLNPSAFGYTVGGSPAAGTQYFQPPFNYVSNYRDPGKINLNTNTDPGGPGYPGVFAGLMNGMTSPTFQQLCDSRRCDGQSTGTVINPGTALPTYFGNSFRSAAGADLVPLASMMHSDVNATLLRAGGSTPDSASVPLFASNTAVTMYNNTARNSYFAYQGLERIANNVTTRSNVFAVWLTIGYFEVVPNGSVDAGHPDGYQLGEEIGSDTGDLERHRAFYIFDRSIPVGYERGQNHNVPRAILLKRYIE